VKQAMKVLKIIIGNGSQGKRRIQQILKMMLLNLAMRFNFTKVFLQTSRLFSNFKHGQEETEGAKKHPKFRKLEKSHQNTLQIKNMWKPCLKIETLEKHVPLQKARNCSYQLRPVKAHSNFQLERSTRANGKATSETVMAYKLGKMAPNTLVNGRIIWSMVLENSYILMPIVMRGSGKIIRPTAMGYTYIKMAPNMKASGKMIFIMELAWRLRLIIPDMKDFMKRAKSKG